MKKITLFAVIAVAVCAFGCTKQPPTETISDFSPLRINNFALCDGNQLESGTLQYTFYRNMQDWMNGTNVLLSGSAEFPVDLYLEELVDGETYYYDMTVSGSDNWFGGNIFAKTEANFSMTYRATGNNTMVPKLYNGATDLLGDYQLTDIIAAGISFWNDADDCLKDNFITISKDFSMTVSEGSDICAGAAATEGHEFYYANCLSSNEETLESFESDWLGESSHESIVFDQVSGLSRLTLTQLFNGGSTEFVYIRQ
ncbi:MAG: hypothetical protein AAGN35_02645 [Bacteroidota bacterium]